MHMQMKSGFCSSLTMGIICLHHPKINLLKYGRLGVHLLFLFSVSSVIGLGKKNTQVDGFLGEVYKDKSAIQVHACFCLFLLVYTPKHESYL